MRPKRLLPPWLLAAGLALPAVLPCARAAILHWDGTSTGPDAEGGAGIWNTTNTNWDTAATGGADVPWTTWSTAVFAGVGGTVTLDGTVAAALMEFRSPGYILKGGSLTFTFGNSSRYISTGANDVIIESPLNSSPSFSKTGTGTLTLHALSGAYGGTITVSEGTLKAGGNGGTAGTGGEIIITQNGSFDLDGRNFSQKPIRIAGAGKDGKGTIVNHSTTVPTGLRSLRLDAAATIGGTTRWDIASNGTFSMGLRTLTKVGSGSIYLQTGSITSPGHFDIKEGSFWLDMPGSPSGTASNTVTVRGGATLGLTGGNSSTKRPWTAALEDGAKWDTANRSSSSGIAIWNGPVNLSGAITLNVAHSFTMTHAGAITGSGSVTKTGDGTWTLTANNGYSGGIILNEGKTMFNPAPSDLPSASAAGAVTVNAGAVLELPTPGALGGGGVPGVTSLTVNSALVENTSNGSNNLLNLTLSEGVIRSGGSVSQPLPEGRFTTLPGGSIHTLSAESPSFIEGRLELGGSDLLPFHIGGEDAAGDLLVDAVLTESVPGRGISKFGEGTMVLRAPALFTGVTSVHSGTLVLGRDGTLPSSSVTVHDGGRFGTVIPGKTLSHLQAEDGGKLLLPATAGTTTTITGALDLAGGNIAIQPVLGTHFATGTYDLATAGSITGTGTPVLDLAGAYGATRATGSLAIVGNKLQLHLTGTGADLVWNNASAGGDHLGTWNTLSADFSLDGADTTFQAYDRVTFDDTAAPGYTKTISLGADLAPARITVNNSDHYYHFTSGGRLVGGGSLVKTGTSELFFGGEDSYAMTGDVTAGGGLLDFSGQEISIGHLIIADGGELRNATVESRTTDLRSGRVSAVLSGDGAWQKATDGTVELTAQNQLTSPGLVAEGTLLLGYTGDLGSIPVHIAAGATLGILRSSYASVPNTLSGPGQLDLRNGIFSLPQDNSNFSGILKLTDADLTVEATESVGTSAIHITGDSTLRIVDMAMDNAIHLDPGPLNVFNWEHLTLAKATLPGPIKLAAGSTSIIRSLGGGDFSTAPFNNVISGAITEEGGPASVILNTGQMVHHPSLVLAGHSLYTGATLIEGSGVVKLNGSIGGSAVTVTSQLGGSGTIHSGGSLTFTRNGILRANLNGDPLRVEGDVDLGEDLEVRLDLANPSTNSGPIPILEYTGTLSGDTSRVTAWGGYRQAVFDFTPGLITLDIDHKTLVWKGHPDQLWQQGGTIRRWKSVETGEDELFFRGDSVIFDDTGTTSLVGTSGLLEPSAVLFDNSEKSLLFNGAVMGPCTITKRGTGDVLFQGENHHTGGTFIEAGHLETRVGSLGTGPVVVSDGATLTGSSGCSGPLTVRGVLNPGVNYNTNRYIFTAGSTVLSGTYQCQIGDGFVCDRLDVTGDLDITGGTLSLDNTYRTFGGDWNYFTIATWTGNLTGTFASLSGMPDGFEIVYDIPNKRIIVKPHDFDRWMEDYPGLSDTTDEGDPDGDGIPNLVEFFLAGDPFTQDHGILPKLSFEGDDFVLVSFKRRDISIHDTVPVVQWAADLAGPWNDYTFHNWNGGFTLSDNGDEPDDITVRLTRQPGKMFVRLKVSRK